LTPCSVGLREPGRVDDAAADLLAAGVAAARRHQQRHAHRLAEVDRRPRRARNLGGRCNLAGGQREGAEGDDCGARGLPEGKTC
jgi:hypothetical protein